MSNDEWRTVQWTSNEAQIPEPPRALDFLGQALVTTFSGILIGLATIVLCLAAFSMGTMLVFYFIKAIGA